MAKLRAYKHLPVTVVEDHNEVIPHIHRAIASRHLPAEHLTLIHFDSHPDMLIPLEMDADLVFCKEKLYESTSIENWILLAVYAGHIDHVLWLKPPWCEQIQDKTITFFVGQSIKTGCIRTTCKENYFVSETLYTPEDQLINKKKLTFSVKTVTPRDWQEELGITGAKGSDQNNEVFPPCSVSNASGDEPNKSQCQIQEQKGNNQDDLKGIYSSDTSEKKERLKPDSENCPNVCNSEKSGNKRLHQSCTNSEIQIKRQKILDQNSHEIEDQSKLIVNQKTDNQSKMRGHVMKDTGTGSGDAPGIESIESDQILKRVLESIKKKHFILDIDLDFFSTKNPFQEMYSPYQYEILKELYFFDKPLGDSDQAIQNCVENRQRKLDSLKRTFVDLMNDKDTVIDHPRKEAILSLVKDLTCDWTIPADLELLHEAGCTCDDTELPHHVSSETQILKLVDATQELLSHFPKPTIVTIARSSSDDYCPQNQVDYIQDQVLEMLQELFLEISVTMDYDESSNT